MKLIKFIAAAALVASTSLVSGGNAVSVGVSPQIAASCYNWPHCRDVDIADQTPEQQYIAACYNWPHCRDVDIVDQTPTVAAPVQTETVRKAV